MTRPPSRVYKSLVKVTPMSPTHYVVTSDPHPIHTAQVRKRGDGTWHVSMSSMPLARSFIDSLLSDALNRAGDWVGRAAGEQARRFTPAQRYSMGQQRCPYLLGGSQSGAHTCDESPEVGTVWCRWHPGGKDKADG